MAIFNFLKTKKDKEKAKEKSEMKNNAKKDTESLVSDKKVSFKGESIEASHILKEPVITEKSTILSADAKYVFRVTDRANKPEIKNVIEKLYDVKVLAVNILNVPHKHRKAGKSTGTKSSFRKAIITLQKGQKIDILS